MRILLIEDEEKIASFIARGLKENKFAVDVATDGEDGQFKAEEIPYDLIILDLMLPGKDGLEICNHLRGKGINTPILMLTARNAVKDRVNGLNAGADDYLTKPFAFGELLARVRALLRRQSDNKTPVLKVADLELNQHTQEVSRQNQLIPLTSKEFSLLEFLLVNANQVVSRTMISEHVWNEEYDPFTNVIDVYIKHLRDKVDKDFTPKLIHTIRGSGYILKNPQ